MKDALTPADIAGISRGDSTISLLMRSAAIPRIFSVFSVEDWIQSGTFLSSAYIYYILSVIERLLLS